MSFCFEKTTGKGGVRGRRETTTKRKKTTSYESEERRKKLTAAGIGTRCEG